MKKFLMVFLVVIRLYVCYRVVGGLIMNSINPQQNPLDNITWWIYYLIFDIWLQQIIPNNVSESNDESENS
jgi:hypothetical protein